MILIDVLNFEMSALSGEGNGIGRMEGIRKAGGTSKRGYLDSSQSLMNNPWVSTTKKNREIKK